MIPSSTCRAEYDFDRAVRRLTERHSRIWLNGPGDPPLFLQPFSRQEQREHEKEVEGLRREHEPLLTQGTPRERAKAQQSVLLFLAGKLPRRGQRSVKRFLEESRKAGEKFAVQAKKFDPALNDGDLHQAVRNLWVFNSIQSFLGKPVSLTPSSFAYSLLYPYTDNWLDALGGTAEERAGFLRWLSLQLHGHPIATNDPRKQTIAALLGMIGDEHPRARRPDVHRSLLAIHRAQKKALALAGPLPTRLEQSLVPLTVEKGGTSVLADGVLAGPLNEGQADAVFGYGVLLQFIDDLQDVEEDTKRGHSTPFERAIENGTLEGITNRLFWLTRRTAGLLRTHSSVCNGQVTMLMERASISLIQEAVVRHRHHYRKAYLDMLDRFAPARLQFMSRMRNA